MPGLVQFILGFGLSHQLALEERRASYLLLVESYNLNEELYESSGALLQSELRVMDQMKVMTAKFEEPVKEVNKIEKRNFLSQLKELGNE